jgi:hypothetical protein
MPHPPPRTSVTALCRPGSKVPGMTPSSPARARALAGEGLDGGEENGQGAVLGVT